MIAPSTLIIADDHPMVQAAVGTALSQVFPDATIIGAATLDDLVNVVRSAKEDIDLILLDLNMPGAVGFTGLFLLQAEFPTVPVAVLSAEKDPLTIRRAIACGASGYIPKHLGLAEVAQAVTDILQGRVWTPECGGAGGMELITNDDADFAKRLSSLSPQQLRILARIVEGKLNKQIAAELNIAEQTVKVHVSTILRKFGVLTRTQAAVLADRMTGRPSAGPMDR